MAKAPETVSTAPRKRRSFKRGPRIATILLHIEEGKPVVDILTFSGNGFDILDKHTQLTSRGFEPVLVRYEMPASTAKEAADAEDDGDEG
jgi:hypothetical protein